MERCVFIILIVDHDPMSRALVTLTLRPRGYNVIAASAATDALETFFAHHEDIALVIADPRLPDMTGPQFLDALATIDPGVPVIARLTGDVLDHQLNLHENVVDAVGECDTAELLARVRRALEPKPLVRAAPPPRYSVRPPPVFYRSPSSDRFAWPPRPEDLEAIEVVDALTLQRVELDSALHPDDVPIPSAATTMADLTLRGMESTPVETEAPAGADHHDPPEDRVDEAPTRGWNVVPAMVAACTATCAAVGRPVLEAVRAAVVATLETPVRLAEAARRAIGRARTTVARTLDGTRDAAALTIFVTVAKIAASAAVLRRAGSAAVREGHAAGSAAVRGAHVAVLRASTVTVTTLRTAGRATGRVVHASVLRAHAAAGASVNAVQAVVSAVQTKVSDVTPAVVARIGVARARFTAAMPSLGEPRSAAAVAAAAAIVGVAVTAVVDSGDTARHAAASVSPALPSPAIEPIAPIAAAPAARAIGTPRLVSADRVRTRPIAAIVIAAPAYAVLVKPVKRATRTRYVDAEEVEPDLELEDPETAGPEPSQETDPDIYYDRSGRLRRAPSTGAARIGADTGARIADRSGRSIAALNVIASRRSRVQSARSHRIPVHAR